MNKVVTSRGFTIVELLIVVVVIAILAAVTVVAYNGIQNRTRDAAAKQAVATVGKKLQTYVEENAAAVPVSLATIGVVDNDSVTYQYAPNTAVTPSLYCLTATSGNYTYHIASGGSQTAGPCVGHTGVQVPNLSCPSGFITVPGNSLYGTQAFCTMKYEAKNVSGAAASIAAGLPWVSISQIDAKTTSSGACSGCHLIKASEWLTIAANLMSVSSNWSGGAVGSGAVFTGHNDNWPSSFIAGSTNDSDGYYATENTNGTQRRTHTLTNGEVIWDFVGNAWEWIDLTTQGAGKQPGLPTDTTETYKNWTDPGVTKGEFGYFAPAYASSLAATGGWGSNQGLGQMITNTSWVNERGFIMGGAFTTGYVNTGLFTLRLNIPPTQNSTTVGFRVAR